MSIGVPQNIKNLYIGGPNVPGTVYTATDSGGVTISGTGFITGLGMQLEATNDVSGSLSLNNGQSLTFTATLSNDEGKRLFGMPTISFFEDVLTEDGLIPSGANIGASDYIFTSWIDNVTDDGKNIKFKGYLLNQSGGTHTIYVLASFRYIAEEGGAS